MRVKLSVLIPTLAIGGIFGTIWYLASRGTVAILEPKGTIALQQRNLIWIALGLILLVVLPVFAMTAAIAWKYREGNKKAKYTPDWDGNTRLELIWWGIPLLIITVLAGITWRTSHTLDPYRPLSSTKEPVTIQVVALQYKWLFIYPGEHIATVNYIQIPEDTPVNFEITADAPMNSFWVPQLGGQVYAMAGMKTKLHLEANEPGTYNGSSANLSGSGFADMQFKVTAVTEKAYASWLQTAKKSTGVLDLDTYNQLAKPGTKITTGTYSAPAAGLYDTVVMKYMQPAPAQAAGRGDGDAH